MFATALAAGTFACPGLGDFTGGEPDASNATHDARPDASGDEIARREAGGDRDSDADALGESGGDVVLPDGPRFCESVDATFCADFDEENLLQAFPAQQWSMPRVSTDSLGRTTKHSPPSRPYALQVVNMVEDAGDLHSTWAQLVKQFPSVVADTKVTLSVYFGDPPTEYIDVMMFQIPAPACAYGDYEVHLRGESDVLGNVQLATYEFCETYVIKPLANTAMVGQWTTFVVDLDLDLPDAGTPDGSAGSGLIAVSIDGDLVVSNTLHPPVIASPPSTSVLVGVLGAINGEYDAPWTVDYDNVIIDLH